MMDDTSTPNFTPTRVSPRRDGWTAERQRMFIERLADVGCVAEVCRALNISPVSAFRFRRRPGAELFSKAWDEALVLATQRLTAMAFHRALYGSVKEVWVDGRQVRTERQQSDRLLMFLLRHYDPRRYANPHAPDRRARAARALPGILARFADNEEEIAPHALFTDAEEHMPAP